YSRDSDGFSREEWISQSVETGGAGDCRTQRTGSQPADFLLLDRWFRYAQRSTGHAGRLVYAIEPCDVRVLSSDAGVGRGEQRDDLHAFGVQPDVAARFEWRNGPRLGRTSDDYGRSREGQRDVWHFPNACARWTGRYREQRTVDSHD